MGTVPDGPGAPHDAPARCDEQGLQPLAFSVLARLFPERQRMRVAPSGRQNGVALDTQPEVQNVACGIKPDSNEFSSEPRV